MQYGDKGRMKKYLFWAMAAITGLPAVVAEMRSQQTDPAIQDAAICAVIDIFDDNLDGEYCLKGDDRQVRTEQVLEGMRAIVEAMRMHLSSLPVQYRGAHAVAVLYGLLPEGSEVPSEVMEVVLAAWWRNPTNLRVGCGVCTALRAFLSPSRSRDKNGVASALTMLRKQDMGPSLRHALEKTPDSKHSTSDEEVSDLLEGAAYVLAVLEGPEHVLNILCKESCQPFVQSSGLKALCELGRAFPELFPAETAAKVVAASEAMARSSECQDVHRNAELLHGLMRVHA
jgi:hypothetical protein